jgi:WD40 repeat protein
MPPTLNQAASSSSSPAVSKAVAAPQRPVDGWAIRNCLGHNAEVRLTILLSALPLTFSSGLCLQMEPNKTGHPRLRVCPSLLPPPSLLDSLTISAHRDKAAVVNIWNIPPAPTDGSGPDAAAHWISPVHSAATSSAGMADLTAMDWSADGSLLAVASYDAVMRVLTADGDIYMSDPQHKGPVFASQFSRSGRWLLTGSLDGTACVWDVPARKLEMMYRCHIGARRPRVPARVR